MISKKLPFSRNFDICELIDKKRFFKNALKKPRFPRSVDIFGDMSKKLHFARNVDIFGQKNEFSKVISK